MKKLLLLFVFIAMVVSVTAQEISSMSVEDYKNDTINKGHFSYIELKLHSGGILQGTKNLGEFFAEGHSSSELRIGFQSTGRKKWQRTWNYPQYGIGFFAGDMRASATLDSIIGTPAGIYGFIGMPWYRSPNEKFWFNTDLAAGLSYGFTPYDVATNPLNDVIGSRVNVYFNLQLATYYRISDRIDLNLGAGLIHFSNGRWRTPNLGINLVGLNMGVAYHFNPMGPYVKSVGNASQSNPLRPQFIVKDDEESENRTEINIIGALGTNSNKPIKAGSGLQGNSFLASSVIIDYAHRFWERGKVTTGLDLFYDASLGETYVNYQYTKIEENGTLVSYPVDADGNVLTTSDGSPDYSNPAHAYSGTLPHDVQLYQKVMAGWHVGHDLLIERFTLVTQFGMYIYKQSPKRGGWYLRAGGKVSINEHLFANITLKTQNGGISDWVEFGMGYRIFKD